MPPAKVGRGSPKNSKTPFSLKIFKYSPFFKVNFFQGPLHKENMFETSLYSVYIHIKHINLYSSRLALKFFEDPSFFSIFSQNFQIPPFFRVKMFRDPLLEKVCLNHHYLVDKMHIKHFLYFDTCIEIFQWFFSKTPFSGSKFWTFARGALK